MRWCLDFYVRYCDMYSCTIIIIFVVQVLHWHYTTDKLVFKIQIENVTGEKT